MCIYKKQNQKLKNTVKGKNLHYIEVECEESEDLLQGAYIYSIKLRHI